MQAFSVNPRHVVQNTLQLADLVYVRLETNVMTGSGTNCRKVTFALDSGAAMSAAPKSLVEVYPMQIEEPRSYKTATGEPVQDEGFRVLPIVTEEGLHRCVNFRVAFVHITLVSASKCAMKVTETFGIPSQDKVACSTNSRMNGSGCEKREVSTSSTVGFLRQRQLAKRDRRRSSV